MARRAVSRQIYGTVPTTRTVYGLAAFRNAATGFTQDRVEKRDFGARSYVYCHVGEDAHRRLMVFGWLNDKDSALLDEQVAVVTLTPKERRALRAHLLSSLTPPQAIDFW
jgi:hypothetical protein